VAADSLARSQGADAATFLLEALNKSYLINRHFAERQLERLHGIELADFEYHFYMTPQERVEPIKRMRAKFAPVTGTKVEVMQPQATPKLIGPRPN